MVRVEMNDIASRFLADKGLGSVELYLHLSEIGQYP